MNAAVKQFNEETNVKYRAIHIMKYQYVCERHYNYRAFDIYTKIENGTKHNIASNCLQIALFYNLNFDSTLRSTICATVVFPE